VDVRRAVLTYARFELCTSNFELHHRGTQTCLPSN
jgi:hypothetical protein